MDFYAFLSDDDDDDDKKDDNVILTQQPQVQLRSQSIYI